MTSRQKPQFFGFPPPQGTPFLCASVYFETDKNILGTDEEHTLNQVVDALVLMAAWKEEVACSCIGYADIRGTYGHNVNLSTNRANAVRLYLVNKTTGIRFDIRTVGMSTMFAHSRRDQYADDRRVDVKITTPLMKDGIGFEFDESAAAGVFVKDLEKAEIANGGKVMAWMEWELRTIKEEHEEMVRYGWKRADQVSWAINRMTTVDFIRQSRQHTKACAQVAYTALPGGRHRVTVRITDPLKTRLLVPEVTVENSSHSALSKELYAKLRAGHPNINRRIPQA